MKWWNECVVMAVRPQNEGGQHVGAVNYPVRVTHEPTGLVAECGYQRSQHKNKETAMSMIEWGLVALKYPTGDA